LLLCLISKQFIFTASLLLSLFLGKYK
jgi:hypothetical protein